MSTIDEFESPANSTPSIGEYDQIVEVAKGSHLSSNIRTKLSEEKIATLEAVDNKEGDAEDIKNSNTSLAELDNTQGGASMVKGYQEETTTEKIKQVQNRSFLYKYLEARQQNLLKGANETAEEEVNQNLKMNYQKTKHGELEMINKHHLQRQKQVLGFLIKQCGSNLFSGKSIMSISLPVTIFEPRSYLERSAETLAYAPHFLEKAGILDDTLEQFKLAITYFVASLHLGTNPQKPFNPILGETFQGLIGGCPVYAEQILHHPPTTSLQMIGKNFTVEGNSEFTAAMSLNSVKSKKIGLSKVIYKNTNTTVIAQYPTVLMQGTAIGKRTFVLTDKFYIFDIENRYYVELDFDLDSNSSLKKKAKLSKVTKDQFYGFIYKINDKFAEILRQNATKMQELQLKFKEKEHVTSQLDAVEGSWLENLKIGGKAYWTCGETKPYKLQYFDNPLPSDANFRLDVLYLKANDETKSQEWKKTLEELQRGDRKLREQYKTKGKK